MLFYTMGYPGAGKTTLAKSLSGWLSAVHLQADQIGFELFQLPRYSVEERRIVHEEMQRLAAENLRLGRHVLYDASNNTYSQRSQLVALADQYRSQAIGLWLQLPIEVAKQRAAKVRNRGLANPVARVIPPHIFDQYAATFEPPRAEEDVLRIAGDAQFHLQYRRLQRQMRGRSITLPRTF